jgi:hypothetical protein
MYLGAANVVQGYVESCENPYKAMLDRKVREQIQQELLERIRPILVEKAMRTLEKEEIREATACVLMQDPQFRRLKRNLTPQGIIQFYRKIGATTVARELERQNLEPLLDGFRDLLGKD